MAKSDNIQNATRLQIWDLPTRLFHWSLVGLMGLSWFAFSVGGVAGLVGKLGYKGFITDMDIHSWAGYGVLILVAYRLVYGFVGSTTARFAHFLRGPGPVLEALKDLPRRDSPPHVGHNPVGGLMIVGLLTLTAVVAGTGLFANDDIINEGPLYRMVSKATSDYLTHLHGYWFNLLLGLVALHVSAILFYLLYKKDNLLKPMITGFKAWAAEPPVLRFTQPALAVGLLMLSATGFWWLVLK